MDASESPPSKSLYSPFMQGLAQKKLAWGWVDLEYGAQ
jgi:hypothetical protein